MRRDKRQEVLDELAALREHPSAPASLATLRRVLGDEEPPVVVDCLLGLLQLDPTGALPFVTGLLEPMPVAGHPPRDRAAEAVRALGGCDA
ncbi:MAG TPA: hypothetical protein VMX54_19185 [Vicinamibacteria bacterium]|nr:hypothetical protein [Vicinamibacteria bacterium]